MCDALETLREVDQHFQRLTGVDVPSAFKHDRKAAKIGLTDFVYVDPAHYGLWRRVRSAIASLEREGR